MRRDGDKPMMPAHDTSAPTASATATSTRRFSRCTGTPRSAPRFRRAATHSARRVHARAASPIATHGATAASADHCAPPRLPRLQKVSERNCASSATNVRLIAAPTSALIAMPASSSSGSASRRDAASRERARQPRARLRTRRWATRPRSRARQERGPSTIIVVAPSARRSTPTVGKRVAEQRLHRGAGRPKPPPTSNASATRARGCRPAPRAPAARPHRRSARPGFRERNAIGADAQRDDGHHAHETGERGQRERAKRRDVPMRARRSATRRDAGKAKRERASGRSGIRRAHPTGVGAGS